MTRMECIDAMNRYANMVMRIALNYCKNKYDAEDVTQDVFCKLVKHTEISSVKDNSLLPRKYRIPIYLHYYEEYSTKEIAEILEIKEATVRAQLMRGRNILKKKLEEGKGYERTAEV